MIRNLVIIGLLVLGLPKLVAEDSDSTSNPLHYDIEQVVITATRTPNSLLEAPAQAHTITASRMEMMPMANLDDVLRSVSNVHVNRSWGIFSRNASVTMRGLPGSARTLILIDGVPKNKIAGGSVNWHNVHPDIIERMEVIKGPGSALYGNNAMGGVLNIITKKPEEALSGSVEVLAGSYGTLGGNAILSGHTFNESGNGFYWSLNGNYRQGEGYIFEPLEYLDDMDVSTYLEEYGGGTRLGYQFGEGHYLDLSANIYDELRGGGVQVYEDMGTFDAVLTRDLRLHYRVPLNQASFDVKVYRTDEDYKNQKESLNSSGEYSLSDAGTDKADMGTFLSFISPLPKNNRLTAGIEARSGDVRGQELYRTSTDEIYYRGMLDFLGIFIQDEFTLPGGKFRITGGLRADLARFRNGSQEVRNPGSKTGFAGGFSKEFEMNHWQALSPKLSLQYRFSPGKSVYLSAGTGFNPPKIEDLVKSGKIRKGFRLANPGLLPEKISSIEAGFKGRISESIFLSTALYHSTGNDFHYLSATGDTLETGGGSPRPVFRRENLGRVGISGFELSLDYLIISKLSFQASYSYNHSVIRSSPGTGLEGKMLAEVPPHLLYAGIAWRNRFFTAHLNCSFTDAQYADDGNLVRLEEYFLVNARVQSTLFERVRVNLSCQNMFDVQFIDRKNKLSPGRYISAGVKVFI